MHAFLMEQAKISLWLLLELLHFGIKHSLYVLKSEKLAQHISMFQIVYDRTGCYHLNCLLYMLTTYL